jgi:anti-sigma-K factor RskA
MNTQHRENGQHIDDLIDAYALGALDADETARVEDHLESCAACRALAAAARARADALLYAAPLVEPPLDLRARVLWRVHTIAEEERAGRAPALRARQAGSVGRQGLLGRMLGGWRREEGDETLRQLSALLADPEVLVWDVNGTPEAPGARAHLVGPPAGREAVLVTAGLATLPAERAYQVWLLRGGQPVPNALFRVGVGGEGRLVVRASTRLRDVDAVAVTPEPAAGSPAPTGPIMLMGELVS